ALRVPVEGIDRDVESAADEPPVPGPAAVLDPLPWPIPVEAAGLLTPEAGRVLDRAVVLALEVLLQGPGGNHLRRPVLVGNSQEVRDAAGCGLEGRNHEIILLEEGLRLSRAPARVHGGWLNAAGLVQRTE